MGAVRVTRISQGTIIAYQITTSGAQDLVDAGTHAGLRRIDGSANWATDPVLGVRWTMQLRRPGEVPQEGGVGDWIVLEAGSAAIYSGADFPSVFSADPSVLPLQWAALTTPPSAAVANGQVLLTFPQPTSANRPFSYTVEQTHVANGTTQAAVLVGQPVIDAAGNVTLTVGDISVDGEYTFVVSVQTTYGTSDAAAPTTPIAMGPDAASAWLAGAGELGVGVTTQYAAPAGLDGAGKLGATTQ